MDTYETVECDCKRTRAEGLSLHPRYCGQGRAVTKPVEPIFARDRVVARETWIEPAHPEPEIRATPAPDEWLPVAGRPSARKLAQMLREAGWTVRATYARGTLPGPQVGTVVDSHLVRASTPDGGVLIAVQWVDGKLDTTATWARGQLVLNGGITRVVALVREQQNAPA